MSLTKCVELKPDALPSLVLPGNVEAMKGQFDAASADYRKARETDANHPAPCVSNWAPSRIGSTRSDCQGRCVLVGHFAVARASIDSRDQLDPSVRDIARGVSRINASADVATTADRVCKIVDAPSPMWLRRPAPMA